MALTVPLKVPSLILFLGFVAGVITPIALIVGDPLRSRGRRLFRSRLLHDDSCVPHSEVELVIGRADCLGGRDV